MLQDLVEKHCKVKNGFQFLQQVVEKIYEGIKLMVDYIAGHMFMQMMAEVGIRKHGQVAVDALFKEFVQLHNLEVFEGVLVSDLSQEQRINS